MILARLFREIIAAQSIAELICQVFLCYVRITDAAFQKARGVSVFDSGSHSSLVFVSVQNFSVYFGSLRAKFS